MAHVGALSSQAGLREPPPVAPSLAAAVYANMSLGHSSSESVKSSLERFCPVGYEA